MDVKQVFDSLARQEEPPMAVDVGRAVAAGRAVRRRRRAVGAGASAVLAFAVGLGIWAGYPRPGQERGFVATVPGEQSYTFATPGKPSVTVTVTPWPTYEGFAELKKEYPPKGRIAFVAPLLMWVSDAPAKKGLFLCESGPNGGSCTGFRPLAAKEYARVQGKLRGAKVWFGFAGKSVHGVTAVTEDGRKIPAKLTQGVGPGLGIWSVAYPPGADARTLVVTGAKGRTLQRLDL